MDDRDTSQYRVYTDGSGFEGNAGAAAVLYKRGHGEVKSIRFHLGSLRKYGTYEAELIGMSLGVHLLQQVLANFAPTRSLIVDNTSALSAPSRRRARSGQHLVEEIVSSILDLPGRRPKLAIRWGKGHVGIAGNERADTEAKKAAQGESSPAHELPHFLRD
ncbi:hypothetical protein GGF50DRAFT_61032, partial [Schizophyllum commune]